MIDKMKYPDLLCYDQVRVQSVSGQSSIRVKPEVKQKKLACGHVRFGEQVKVHVELKVKSYLIDELIHCSFLHQNPSTSRQLIGGFALSESFYFQLHQQLGRSDVFKGYKEGVIGFRPTYKYDTGTNEWDSRSVNSVNSEWRKTGSVLSPTEMSLHQILIHAINIQQIHKQGL